MANTRLRALVSSVGCIVLVALCGSGAAATQLQWKLAKGKTYYQRTVIEQQINQDIMGQQQKTELSMGTGLKLQVLDVDAQGNMRIQYTYLWTRLKQVNPMAQADYDSSSKSPVPEGAEGFAALVGQSYTIKMTPKGHVVDVNGVEQLRDAVLKKLPAGADTTMGMNPVAMYIDPASVKQMAEANMAIYPDKSVNLGESWTREMAMKMGFTTITQYKWTLQKQEAGVATIGLAATLRTDPNSPPMDAMGMKVKSDLSGTQEGTLQMAEATGLIMSTKERQQLKGQLKIAASADAPPTMVIPMTIDTQVTGEMGEQMWKTSP
jgi:hypothetical protein